MSHPAICLPVFNEGIGICQYLDEVLAAFSSDVIVIVVDDCSSDGTQEVLAKYRERQNGHIVLLNNSENLGHGLTLIAGLRYAIQELPSSVSHVITADGDGQVSGEELFRLWKLACSQPLSVWEGVRNRTGTREARYRRITSAAARWFVILASGKICLDGNTPVRVYPRSVLARWLDIIPEAGVRIPNVLFSVFARRYSSPALAEIIWRDRIGDSQVGSSWSPNKTARAVKFFLLALTGTVELIKGIRRSHP